MAAVAGTRLASTGPRDTSYSKTSRRQYRSCDQCRRGRRACDAHDQRSAPSSLLDPDGYINIPPACSNCTRTGKQCTFKWLKNRTKNRSAQLENGAGNSISQYNRPDRIAEPNSKSPTDYAFPTYTTNVTETYSFPQFGIDSSFILTDTSVLTPQLPTASDLMLDEHDAIIGHETAFHFPQSVANTEYLGNITSEANAEESSLIASMYAEGPILRQEGSKHNSTTNATNAAKPAMSLKRTKGSGSSNTSDQLHRETFEDGVRSVSQRSTFQRPLSHDRNNQSQSFATISEPSLSIQESHLSASFSKDTFSESLLRIYHDSLEHALSCWLTQRNCPYNVEISSRPNFSSMETGYEEWGPQWSNRMCKSVCRLDKEFSAFRKRVPYVSEDRAASRALKAAILAFASQWSHMKPSIESGSQNGRTPGLSWSQDSGSGDFEQFEDNSFSASPESVLGSTDVERSVQETLWHEARRVLRDCADTDSFRAIYAHMIFALTQRPLKSWERAKALKLHSHSILNSDFADRSQSDISERDTFYTAGDENIFSAAELEDLAELDGSPLYLETALRHLFSWRCRIERLSGRNATRENQKAGLEASGNHNVQKTSAEARGTFNMLFWLGVMCDTSSAAINKRPLVISDEDSCIIPGLLEPISKSGQVDTTFDGTSADIYPKRQKWHGSKLWGTYILQTRVQNSNQSVVRWPCSYEDAVAYLCDAIPVKVLLFRKVTCLQTLSYRRTASDKLEECIREALTIYQQWSATYGRFILDCVADHPNLPCRIQSWYTILAGHWHLGCLLLADIIETVDEECKSDQLSRTVRHSSSLVLKLRKENADSIANLARASCCPLNDSHSISFNFHSVLNQGALLTEPWTEILMRSFGKACGTFLDWMSSPHQQSRNEADWLQTHTDFDYLWRQSDICIQALRLLGRKSDLASLAAARFASRLARQRP